MSQLKSFIYVILGCIIGSAVSFLTTVAIAQAAPVKVRGCVTNTLLTVRIVAPTANCLGTETMKEWDQDAVEAVKANNPPFVCTFHCWFSDYPERVKGKDFSYSFIRQLVVNYIDISGTNFSYASLEGTFFGSNLSSSNFSNAIVSTEFEETTLTSANFSNATASANFTNANVQSVNFTNANLQNANFSGATNMNTATLTGVTWGDSTTCPDGTLTGDHSNTCTGHLTP